MNRTGKITAKEGGRVEMITIKEKNRCRERRGREMRISVSLHVVRIFLFFFSLPFFFGFLSFFFCFFLLLEEAECL